MKNISVALSMLVSLLLYSGCGSVDRNFNDVNENGITLLKNESLNGLNLLKTESYLKQIRFTRDGTIKVDADPNDWRNIRVLNVSKSVTLKSYVDQDFLYILIDTPTKLPANTVLFINSDNDSKTGYKPKEWTNSGFDYVIGTTGAIYRTTTGDKCFGISYVEQCDNYKRNTRTIEIKIKKDKLHLNSQYDLGVRIYSKDWDSFKSLPDGGVVAHAGLTSPQISEDHIAPVIQLKGASDIEIGLNEPYFELGAMAVDDVDGEVPVTLSGSVDSSKEGAYTITYKATDRAGNSSLIKRVVSVKKSYSISGRKITIDADASDWSGIAPIAVSEDRQLRVFTDGDFIYLLLQDNKGLEPNSVFLLNSDNQIQTGYQTDNWNESGFDYLIGTSGTIYKFIGNSSRFNIAYFSHAVAYQKSAHTIELKLKKSDLILNDLLKIGVQSYDGDWEKRESFPDSHHVISFSLQSTRPTSHANDNSLNTIRDMILHSHPHYLCVGDSTRSEDPVYDNGHIVEEIDQTLSEYGVTVINKAVTGMELREFVSNLRSEYSLKQLLDDIPGDGENYIVSINLGLNDYDGDGNRVKKQQIENDLTKIIVDLFHAHPKVHPILVTPNHVLYDDGFIMQNFFVSLYKKLGNKYHIPVINVADGAMKNVDMSWYRKDKNGKQDFTHLNRKGQHIVAKYILSQLLGK